MGTTITVTGQETLEEVYFLIRVGTWHQSHLAEYIELRNNDAYNQGLDDGTAQANDQGWESEYQRGFDDGYERGFERGGNEGYKDGYADGSREGNYDNRR